MEDELIMCVQNDPVHEPGTLGLLHGPSEIFFAALNEVAQPQLRSAVENQPEPTYKQIVTYVMITISDPDTRETLVLAYERLKGGKDKRLHNGYSIGFGGHVKWIEGKTAEEMVSIGLLDEMEEELNIPLDPYSTTYVGEIQSDIDKIGLEHTGLLYHYHVMDPSVFATVRSNEPHKMRLFWVPLDYLDILEPKLENWSRVAVRAFQKWII